MSQKPHLFIGMTGFRGIDTDKAYFSSLAIGKFNPDSISIIDNNNNSFALIRYRDICIIPIRFF
ncbi:MAG: hypothetical protein V3R45_02435 [Candidatus Aminicenantaceae bacterium]